jgi:hypothetical protein
MIAGTTTYVQFWQDDFSLENTIMHALIKM